MDLDLAAGLDHEGMDTAAYATAAVRARLDESADLDFRAPRDTAGHAVAAVMTRLEDAADEVPEAGALPREAAPSPQLDDVPEAGALGRGPARRAGGPCRGAPVRPHRLA